MLQKYKTKKFYDLSINQTLGKPIGTGTYSYIGQDSTTAGGNSLSNSLNVGATACQMILLIAAIEGTASVTACTVGGVSLTQIYTSNNIAVFVGIGLGLTGSQTVSVTWSASHARCYDLWAINGLASTTAKSGPVESSDPVSFGTVNGGDLMFAMAVNFSGATGTFTSSSQQPFEVNPASIGVFTAADWTINSNNVAFDVNSTSAGGATTLAVTWH